TRIRSAPPCSASTSMRVLPASMAFSSSSLTTLAGRSMTSPAAIWLTTTGGSCWMRPTTVAPNAPQTLTKHSQDNDLPPVPIAQQGRSEGRPVRQRFQLAALPERALPDVQQRRAGEVEEAEQVELLGHRLGVADLRLRHGKREALAPDRRLHLDQLLRVV